MPSPIPCEQAPFPSAAGRLASGPGLLEAAAMAGLIAANALAQTLRQDLVPAGDGLGWDGALYGQLAKDLHLVFQVAQVVPERIQRVLPSAVVGTALKLLHVAATNSHVILAFRVQNLVCLLLGLLAYRRIAGHCGWAALTRWLGFVCVFFCFPSAKLAFYYPVLTDMPALALGLWAVSLSLSRNLPGLAAVFLLSAGTWSSLPAWILPLMVFPPGPLVVDQPRARPSYAAGLLAAAAYLLGVCLSYGYLGYRPYPHAQQVLTAWVALSAVIGAAYLGLGVQGLQEGVGWPKAASVHRRISWPGAAGAVSMMILVRLVFRFALHLPHVHAGSYLFVGPNSLFVRSITLPGIFLVAHAAYYGPLYLVFLLLWKDICQEAQRLGYGYLAVAAFTLFLSLNSESRHWLHAYPFLVMLGLQAIQRRGLERRLGPLVALGTLIASKIWFHINAPVMYGPYTQFPGQRLFMNKGPWISVDMYLLQGLAALIVLWLLARRLGPRAAS